MHAGKGKGKAHVSQLPQQAGAYPGFYRMNEQEVFLLPLDEHASSVEGYPQHYVSRYLFIHLDRVVQSPIKLTQD